MRLLRGIAPVVALIAAISVRAAVAVRFHIDADGKLHMTERLTVDVPPSVQRLERTYREDAEQRVTVDAITLNEGDGTVRLEDSADLDRAHAFRQMEPGRVVWSVREQAAVPASTRTLTYVIESQVSDAVIPAWSIPRGMGLRAVIPLWREALKNPRHRFLVDYRYPVRLQIGWPAGWKPVREIAPGVSLFEENSRRVLTGIDVPRHAVRMASLAGLPIVGLLFWLVFVLIGLLRRRRGPLDDEQLVRDAVYSQPPEKIEAQCSGRAPYVTVGQFLRRLERERKIAVTVEKRGGGRDDLVTLRLLVPRAQLTPYEGLGIQILLRDGWVATSDEIRARRDAERFDAEGVLNLAVRNTAARAKQEQRAPWYSRLTSLAFFVAGIYFAIQETVRLHREPAVLAVTLIAASLLFVLWPNRIVREAVRASLRNALLLLIPLAIFTAISVAVHFTGPMPPGYFASAGMSLAFLGTYQAMLANSAPRGDARLDRARNWLRRELQSPAPRLRDDAIPWLHALGLQGDIARWQRRNPAAEPRVRSTQWTGNPPPEPKEEWKLG